MKIWLPVLFFLTASCLGSIRDKHKPRVVLSWHEKVNRAGVMIRDLGLDVLAEPPGSLPYSSNASAAVWLGVSRRALYDKMRDYGLDGEASAMRTEAGIMGPRKVDLDGDDEG